MNSKINATLVNEKNRLSFLPKHAGIECIRFESMTYNIMENICENYTGAYWEFYELDNHGFYMAPQLTKTMNIFVHSNGFEGILTNDAAGIVSTIYSLNHLACLSESEQIINRYYLLLDFAHEHKEAKEIFAAID